MQLFGSRRGTGLLIAAAIVSGVLVNAQVSDLHLSMPERFNGQLEGGA